MSIENYHAAMLAEIPERYASAAGYPAYDFTRAYAFACALLGDSVSEAENAILLENMSGELLEAYIGQRKAVYRKFGSNAEATLKITAASDTVYIQAGYLFRTTDGLDFQAIDDGDFEQGDTFRVRAVDAGEIYNVQAGTITVLPYSISNLGSVTNEAAATGGSDTESDEELRSRYMLAIEHGGNGTNAGSYEDWAMSVPGVGYAKCLPATPSAGQCKVLLVDEDGNPCASSIVSAVQAYIDPNGTGDGAGMAPMGAICTVAAPQTVTVTVACQQVEGTAATTDIRTAILDYFAGLALRDQTVSYSRIMKAVMAVDGVEDATLTLNGAYANIELADGKVAAPGVTVT